MLMRTDPVREPRRSPALTVARADGRPRPQALTRRFASYSYVRAFYGSEIDIWCAPIERRARRRARTQLPARASVSTVAKGSIFSRR
jgi:hypothetical protein